MASGYSDDGHGLQHSQRYYAKLYFDTVLSNMSAVDPFRAWVSSTPAQGNETASVPYNTHSAVELRG